MDLDLNSNKQLVKNDFQYTYFDSKNNNTSDF
jgi:hypothetical protein